MFRVPITGIAAAAALFALVGCGTTTPSQSANHKPTVVAGSMGCGFAPDPYCLADRIYYDYDSALISSDFDRKILSIAAARLKEHPNISVTIEGHTDERGTREYNLALGERRAIAMRDALRALGVTNKISIISYGKERPAVPGSSEASWSLNRRAVLEIN